MNIAFQGDKGAFSEIMAIKFFPDADYIACKTFKDVFENVKTGKAKYGVIPIENSQTGRIVETTELLVSSNLNICGEGMLNILHCLITNKNNNLKNISKIYAHPETLTQCRNFLSKLNCELVSWYDGAAAAKIVKNNEKLGLIASQRVAKLYDLKILKSGIQDSKENTTRFFIISKKKASSNGKDKTTLVFSTKHQPGSLYRALNNFNNENINLTRLESMPIKNKPWEYLFLIDLQGHIDDEKLKNALKQLKKNTTSIKILGSYPIGKCYD